MRVSKLSLYHCVADMYRIAPNGLVKTRKSPFRRFLNTFKSKKNKARDRSKERASSAKNSVAKKLNMRFRICGQSIADFELESSRNDNSGYDIGVNNAQSCEMQEMTR